MERGEKFKRIKERIWASWAKPYWQAKDPIVAIGYIKDPKNDVIWGKSARYWVDEFIKHSGSWNNREAREIKYELLELMKDGQTENG